MKNPKTSNRYGDLTIFSGVATTANKDLLAPMYSMYFAKPAMDMMVSPSPATRELSKILIV